MLHARRFRLITTEFSTLRIDFLSDKALNKLVKALIIGSDGLIGSECVRLLGTEGWEVVGIDNDMRRFFSGDAGSTEGNTGNLKSAFPPLAIVITLLKLGQSLAADVMCQEFGKYFGMPVGVFGEAV